MSDQPHGRPDHTRSEDLFIRPFKEGDEPALRAVFHSSVHTLATQHYTEEQRHAWAPLEYEATRWADQMRRNAPFVAERHGVMVGYADLQNDGYIDHFYVSGDAAGRGVGTALMRKIEKAALENGIARLYANVSLNAQPFFARHGFVVERERTVMRGGVVLQNARMVKRTPR